MQEIKFGPYTPYCQVSATFPTQNSLLYKVKHYLKTQALKKKQQQQQQQQNEKKTKKKKTKKTTYTCYKDVQADFTAAIVFPPWRYLPWFLCCKFIIYQLTNGDLKTC